MYRRTIQGLAVCLAAAAGALLGQGPAAGPAFEVATVRPAPPITELMQQLQSGKAKVGMTVDANRVDMGFSSLADLIRIAYRVKPYQVQGPEWMAQQRFEIQAKIPEGVSQEQVPEMLQALLRDRFKLAARHEQKDLPVYALIVGKNGPKLTAASDAPEAPLPDSPNAISLGTEKGQLKMVQQGNGVVMQGGGVGTMRVSMGPSGVHMEMSRVTMESLVDTLAPMVDKPIVDMTGLKGTYQFAMDLPVEDLLAVAQRSAAQAGIQLPIGASVPVAAGTPGTNPGDAATPGAGSGVFSALEKLGLKLDARKAPVDTIVVDHLEKTPTEN